MEIKGLCERFFDRAIFLFFRDKHLFWHFWADGNLSAKCDSRELAIFLKKAKNLPLSVSDTTYNLTISHLFEKEIMSIWYVIHYNLEGVCFFFDSYELLICPFFFFFWIWISELIQIMFTKIFQSELGLIVQCM